MKQGDLVTLSGTRWLVRKIERATRSALLVSVTGEPNVVAEDLDESDPDGCRVVCNPPSDWPFVTLALKPKLGQLTSLVRPSLRSDEIVLRSFYDWVIPEPGQMGGALFLSPHLRLSFGDMLIEVHERGRLSLTIPVGFGTTKERVQRKTPPAEDQKRTAYDRLMQSDFDDEDA